MDALRSARPGGGPRLVPRARDCAPPPGAYGEAWRATEVGYVTTYGNHLGDPRFVLILDYSAFVLSVRDAARATRKGMSFQVPSDMTARERELAHEAWECRDVPASSLRRSPRAGSSTPSR